MVCSSAVWTAAVIRSPSCAYATTVGPANVVAGVSVRCDAERDAPAAPYTVRPAHATATLAARTTLIPPPDRLSAFRPRAAPIVLALELSGPSHNYGGIRPPPSVRHRNYEMDH